MSTSAGNADGWGRRFFPYPARRVRKSYTKYHFTTGPKNGGRSLKREGLVTIWTFREILPSQDWDKSIHEKLETASIIIFILSSDFLASDYCVGVELKQALAQRANGDSLVIPIIARACDWKSCSLSSLEVLPLGGKPINSWKRKDEAWLDVTKRLRDLINSINPLNQVVATKPIDNQNRTGSLSTNIVMSTFEQTVSFAHRHKDNMVLSDVFIYPDIRRQADKLNAFESVMSSSTIIDAGLYICLFGDDQSGKSSLANILFRDFYNTGYYPLIVNGSHINSSNHPSLADQCLAAQYDIAGSTDSIAQDRLVMIIDDFEEVNLNRKGLHAFIDQLKLRVNRIIIITSTNFRLELSDFVCLKSFDFYEILPFGHNKRAALIEKWLTLGQEETIGEEDLLKQIDNRKRHVDSIVRKNIVPSRPVFILSILQVLDSFAPSDYNLTSYGYCYHYLIQSLLSKLEIKPNEIDKYFNYITELAYYLFNNKLKTLSETEFVEFGALYDKEYLAVDHKGIVQNLIEAKLIEVVNDRLGFKYKYIYYFFVGKYFASHFSNDSNIRDQFVAMVDKLYLEEYANIIIFITHHTNDSRILDEIQLAMMDVYSNEKEATLVREDLSFLQDFILNLPKLIVEHKDTITERRNINQKLDEADRLESAKDEDDELKMDETDVTPKKWTCS